MTAKIKLNENQKKAVEHQKGPLIVIAGAGTGKTRVITERIKRLVQKDATNPMNILALTFTEKASEEMLYRIQDTMPLAYEEPWVYTFHSFCDRVLRQEALEIGLDPSYKIIPYPNQWHLLRQNFFSIDLKYYRPLGSPTKFIAAILKFISRLQDENISPENLKKYVTTTPFEGEEKQRWEELTLIYQTYQNLKIQNSKMDFGDLITWTIFLFRSRPNILKKYQKQFEHILVDEFQDTNYAQYELIKLLFPRTKTYKRSLTVVGDDSQSIYKFRGAAISNILQFREDYPSTETITLIENYRSGQSILNAAYKLITNNNPDSLESKLGISKELTSHANKADIKPEIIELETLEDEVEFVISKIIEILGKEPQYTYKDFAILARANNHLDPVILTLRKHELPYQLVGNRGLYDRNEIRDLLALLKILVEPTDSISLYRVLNLENLAIKNETVAKLLASAKYEKKTVWEIVQTSEDTQILELLNLIQEYQAKIAKITPVTLVYELVNRVNYLNQFLDKETVENQLCLKNLNLFLNKVKRFEIDFNRDTKEIPTLVDFLEYMDVMIEAGDNPAQAEIEDIDTINLLTVHSSKGLEFPVVFMINLTSTRFPSRNRRDMIEIPDDLIKETLPQGDPHLQEERRLFYVGMTRAQKYLFLTYGKDYGGARETIHSGFLDETGVKITPVIPENSRKPSQESLFGIKSGYREAPLTKITGFLPKSLSFTQLSTYEECPLKYKYSYILNIPTAPSHNLTFGNTIHATLNEFHERLAMEQISLDTLFKIYEKHWNPLGYLDEEHRRKRFESGKDLLTRYYENLDPKLVVLKQEQGFNINIKGINFYGRIDRIDRIDGGVEIIDYKTGEKKEQKYVDKDKQVSLYALGVKEALGLNPIKLTLYFVEDGEKISTTRTQADLEQIKEEVVETAQLIKQGKFEANAGYHCRWCDYKSICPFMMKE